MKKLSFVLFFFFSFLCLSAQISGGGIPPSFKETVSKTYSGLNIHQVELKTDISQFLNEDHLRERRNILSKVATVIPTNLDLSKDGVWPTLSDGTRICRLTISSKGALGLVLYYSCFSIPNRAKFLIYDKYKTQLLGAYTHRTNPKGKEFVTELVYEDALTLEYVSSKHSKISPSSIHISDIVYTYNNVDGLDTYTKSLPDSTGFNTSGYCQVNVNCLEGHRWQLQKTGVTCTDTKIGGSMYRCSVFFINNVNNDKTAYYLSAYHCFYENNNTADFNTILFYFNYEFSRCKNEQYTPEETKKLVVAQLKETNTINNRSDAALFFFNDIIPNDYGVYSSGWDLSQILSSKGVYIHHLCGDVKKISTHTTKLQTTTHVDLQNYTSPNTHRVANFSSTQNGHKTTEGWFSGSPLFNYTSLIVGTLTGGESSCSNRNEKNVFGEFYYHYYQHSNSGRHLKTYLNPSSSDITSLGGLANVSGSLPYPS